MSPDMPSTASRRPRVDAERNRAALIAAARELFESHGPDVALNEIARLARTGNATLYRHFPTRADLIAAVYSDEVAELDSLSRRLVAERSDKGDALSEWLEAFVDHVATKRELAQSIPDSRGANRSERFDEWHASMRRSLDRILRAAKADGAVRRDARAADLLSLAGAVAMVADDSRRARAMLRLLRSGYRS